MFLSCKNITSNLIRNNLNFKGTFPKKFISSPKEDMFIRSEPLNSNELGSKENPYKINLSESQGDETVDYLVKDDFGLHYVITDTKNKEENPSTSGVLKQNAEGNYSRMQRFLQYNYDETICKLKTDHSALLNKDPEIIWYKEKIGPVRTPNGVLKSEMFLRGVKSGEIKVQKYFPTEDSYINHVLKNMDSIANLEKDYLLEFAHPYENEHILYRGIAKSPYPKETLKDFSEDDIDKTFILQYNPMYASLNLSSASRYVDSSGKILRIEVPKGARLPYSEYEIILPSKSNFKYCGKTKVGNLEIINFEYIPFENIKD